MTNEEVNKQIAAVRAKNKKKGLFIHLGLGSASLPGLPRSEQRRKAPALTVTRSPRQATSKAEAGGPSPAVAGRSSPPAVGTEPHPLECSHVSAVQRVQAHNTPSHLGTHCQPATAAAYSPLRHIVIYARILCVPSQELAFDQRLDALLDICWWGREAGCQQRSCLSDQR